MRKLLLIFGLIIAAASLYACDVKDGRDGRDLTADPELAMTTGGCTICHDKQTDDMAHGKHIFDRSGFVPATGGETCAKCHQPDLDYSYINANAKSGLSCTSCHELNGDVKFNPIHSSYAVTADNCMKCHGDISNHWQDPAHAHYFPYVENIAAAYGAVGANFSSHANSNGKAMKDGEPRACGICHSGTVNVNIVQKVSPRSVDNVTVSSLDSEGTSYSYAFRTKGGASDAIYNKFSQYSKDAADLHLDLPGSDSIGCDGCHKPHSLELITQDVKMDGVQITSSGAKNVPIVVASAEFMLCTSCHNANVDIAADGQTAKLSAVYTSDTELAKTTASSYFEHHGADFSGNPTLTILDTHFGGELYTKYTVNKDGTVNGSGSKITVVGYGINPSSANACSNCHDPHGSSVFANGKDNKDFSKIAQSWGAANKIDKGHSGFNHAIASVGCTPCHHARSFATAVKGVSLDTAKSLYPATGSAAPAQIACLTCHVGNTTHIDGQPVNVITAQNAKNLRRIESVAAFNNAFTYQMSEADFNKVNAQYPAPSIMLCGGCHSGGHGGGTVEGAFKDNGANDINMNSGHGSSFGVMSNTIFELTANAGSNTYADGGPLTEHKAFVKTSGCIMCHATDTDNHGFAVFKSGTMKLLKYDNCAPCHTSTNEGDVSNAFGNDVKAYSEQVKSLQRIISNIKLPRGQENGVNSNLVSNETTRKQIGMGYGNLVALAADPGAYAHSNKKFIQQLVCDSIVGIQSKVSLQNLTTASCEGLDLSNIKSFNGKNSTFDNSQYSEFNDDVANVKLLFDKFKR